MASGHHGPQTRYRADAQPNIGYDDLSLCARGPMVKPGGKSAGTMIASFHLNAHIEFLFPYINAVVNNAKLCRNPNLIRFTHDACFCVLYPEYGMTTPVEDRRHAIRVIGGLMNFLNDLAQRRTEIEPSHKTFRRVPVPEILKILPRTNCGDCGYPSCVAFAAMLSQQETVPQKCPGIHTPMAEQAVYPVYDNEGNLHSTVTIDIKTAGTQKMLRRKQHDVPLPEKKHKVSTDISRLDLSTANTALPSPLTSRETAVLRMVAQGATNPEISRSLGISPHTVKSHLIHIFNKLGVNDRTQAAVWAVRHHLV